MIRLKDISRTFIVGDQPVHALRHINLTIERGEYLSIMGPSGSGKSTLLNILGILDRPDAGSYRFEDVEVTEQDDEHQAILRGERIGFVFQFFHLVPRLSAAENVELPLMLMGMSPSQRRQRVDEVLGAVGLADRVHHRPEQLSGGQRQRVAIARAAVTEPALLLADEPTGNLDRASGRDVVNVLEALNRNKHITLIVVTHDPEMGGRAHRRIKMVDGLVQDDQRHDGAP